MNMTIQNSYPCLNEDVKMHVTPSGAQIRIKLDEQERFGGRTNPIPLVFINETARDILLFCDGRNSCQSIVSFVKQQEINKNLSLSEMMEGTTVFLNQMIDFGVLQLFDLPYPRILSSQEVENTSSLNICP